MLAALDCAAVTTTLKPIRTHLDDMVVPCAQAEAIDAELRAIVPHEVCEFLVLAWHHAHLVSHSQAKPKRAHQREREFWWACAEGLVGDEFDTLKALGFDQLDSIVRASSLVEMVNALIRPSLKSCKGQITQATLHLIMFYHNHWRYQSGKRQGKAPIALLTGKPLEAPWWELLLQQVTPTQGVTGPGTPLSSSPLQLVVNNAGWTNRQTRTPGRTIVEPPGTSENNRRQQDSEAAYSFHMY